MTRLLCKEEYPICFGALYILPENKLKIISSVLSILIGWKVHSFIRGFDHRTTWDLDIGFLKPTHTLIISSTESGKNLWIGMRDEDRVVWDLLSGSYPAVLWPVPIGVFLIVLETIRQSFVELQILYKNGLLFCAASANTLKTMGLLPHTHTHTPTCIHMRQHSHKAF